MNNQFGFTRSCRAITKIKMRNLVLSIVSAATLGILTGCATIMGQSAAETLNVRSIPDQANVEIFDESGIKVFEGKTPASLPLEKKRGYFRGKTYSVVIKKEGHIEQTITVDTRLNGWYIGGNLVFGGVLGYLVIDPLTGAMYTLDTSAIQVTLAPSPNLSHQNKSTNENITVMLYEQVPVHLREKMQRIN